MLVMLLVVLSNFWVPFWTSKISIILVIKVRCPGCDSDHETVYDQWKKWYPNLDQPQ